MGERLTKQEKKRLEEESFFKQFIDLYEFQIEGYCQPESDPPDIAWKIGDDTFSIEITKLFITNGEKLIQRQKLIDRLTEKLNTDSQTGIVNNFGVLYQLRPGIRINKTQEADLVNSMIQIVKKRVDANPDRDYLGFEIPEHERPSEILQFELRKFEGIEQKSWYTRKSWMAGPIKNSIIENAIISKTESALKNGYYKNYNKNWLLLVIENEPHSDFSEFKISATMEKELFDKIFILEKINKNLIELM